MASETASATEGARVPQQARSRATRRALLAAAGERFALQGFHGTALNELLGDGVPTKGALYFHFRVQARRRRGTGLGDERIVGPGPARGPSRRR